MADEGDYGKAYKHIDEYYRIRYAKIEDFGNGARDAISNFVDTSSIKNETKVGFGFASLLIDIGLSMLPATKFIQTGLGKIAKLAKGRVRYEVWDEHNKAKLQAVLGTLYEKGEEAAKSAISTGSNDEDESGSAAGFAVSARDAARNVTELLRLHVEFENSVMSACLDLANETRPDRKGQLAQMFYGILGPKPVYDPKEIDAYYKKVELEMYRKFYERSARRLMTTIRTERASTAVAPQALRAR